jgi:galactose-1-phosphate uridylyltransferase
MINHLRPDIFQERVILESADWVWLVPYWAVWPYETMLLPKSHVLRLEDLTESQRNGMFCGFLHTHCLHHSFTPWYGLYHV